MSKDHYISYSQVSLALACPLLYFEMYAIKRREELSPATPPMLRGTKEHKLHEDVMKGVLSKNQGATRAINPSSFGKTFKLLKDVGVPLLSEGKISVPYNDKYGLVLVADVISEGYEQTADVYLADFKSGRQRETDFNQLDFYCYILMREFPKIKSIRQNIIGIGEFYHPPERVYTRKTFKEKSPEVEHTLSYVIDLLEDKLPHEPVENFRCASCLLSTCANYVEDK